MKNFNYVISIPLALLFSTGLAFANAGQKATQADLDAEVADRTAGDAALQLAIDTIELTPGPQGEQGEQGLTGVVDAYSVLGPQVTFLPDETGLISVFCDVGDFPTGGGIFQWQSNQELDDIQILESTATGLWDYPPADPASADNLPSGGWQVRVKYTGDWFSIVSATVQCLSLN